MGTVLEITDLAKGYGEGAARHEVLAGLDLKVEEGELLAVLGFSGAGKTTLISQLAGLERPDRGGVIHRGREVDGPDASRGVVFQSYSLMPWLSVRGNVALAVDACARKDSRAARRERVDRYIDMVGLSHASERRPAELSGGMRQRVALARALAVQPDVLLLDEPLSALDALTRARLQDELADICTREGRTIVLITNDVDEALLLADRVVALTVPPAARFGREFDVTLPRPRERAAMNHDETFIRLRGEITRYLMSLNAAEEDGATVTSPPPNVVPLRRDAKGRAIKTANATAVLVDDALPDTVVRAGASARESDYLRFSDVGKTYPTPRRSARGRRGLRADDGPRRVRDPDRPLRLRQVDGAVHGGRSELDQRRRHRPRRAARHRRRPRPGRGVPGPLP